jgi:hypothetical protein
METMASRLTPLGFIVKWIVAPLSLGAVGYFLVGPRVESQVPKELKEQVQKVAGSTQNEPEAEPVDEDKPTAGPTHNFSEPQVDVSVTALNTRQTRPKKKRRRKRAKPPVVNTAPAGEPAVSPPPPDGGGAADPGTPGL